jgi:hypothetical protein
LRLKEKRKEKKMTDEHVTVTIDRLNIRLKGVSAQAAQAAAARLGPALLEQLAGNDALLKGKKNSRIEQVNAAALELKKGESTNPAGLRERIAAGIAKSVAVNVNRTASTGTNKEVS